MDEKDVLVNSFFENYFLNKEASLELFMGASCNQKCAYCYLARRGNILYPPQLEDKKLVLKNTRVLMEWLSSKKWVPQKVRIFSGEPTVKEWFPNAVEIINDSFSRANRPEKISVPTNCSFLLNDKLTEKIEDLAENSKIPLFFSVSIDGKYCDASRPLISGERSDEFYDDVFSFTKKHNSGFHPMVHSSNVRFWIKNFLWFQEKLKEHKMPFWNIYLLEVRNPEWSKESIREFSKFIDFIVRYTYTEVFKEDPKKMADFVLEKGYGILNIFHYWESGLPCSLQYAFAVRVGDLTWVPCHRLAYDVFTIARIENGCLKAVNPEMMVAVYTMSKKNMPVCETCLIKDLCPGGCLGAQYEKNGDPFTPIPTVCALEHAKVYSILNALGDTGVLEYVLDKVNDRVKNACEQFMNVVGLWKCSTL